MRCASRRNAIWIWSRSRPRRARRYNASWTTPSTSTSRRRRSSRRASTSSRSRCARSSFVRRSPSTTTTPRSTMSSASSHKDKVKVTMMFRGREVTHPERGTAILDRLAEELREFGVVEQRPMQEGRNMTMMMAPSKAVLTGGAWTARRRRRGRLTPAPAAGEVAGEAKSRHAARGPRHERGGPAEAAAAEPQAAATDAAAPSAEQPTRRGRVRPPEHRPRASSRGRAPAGTAALPCHNLPLACRR